jgi:predicted RNA-binding Zn-ribbon protein involved in translation (DUF1610 family)
VADYHKTTAKLYADRGGHDMKCPECGRELDIDFTAEGSLSVICGNCGTMTVIRSEPIKQTEPPPPKCKNGYYQ